ncbi:hypothetical protein [Rouxiella chamberiensis]|uniref:Uncharacterized protein n=1 Tax=Rouxiella chamberiensis TaxID=1513468 RepID=A0ABY7HLM9_9GAMM|nr:hypothetical protein [Rouxiella chamberiensis]WAS99775.1 hypothetical protein O1V66_11725 [Rouxiella chamberiensis]
MRNIKLILAVMALTAVPVTQVAAQQTFLMPIQTQEVAMVNVTGDSNVVQPPRGTLNRKPVRPGNTRSPTIPPAPSASNNAPSAIYY